jgi:biotin synthase
MARIFADILRKARDGECLGRDELIRLLALPAEAPESYQIMAEANRVSKELAGNRAEIHAQFALNLGPCPKDCQFCSFAACHGIFDRATELTADQAVAQARRFESEGANAIFVMTTAAWPLAATLEIAAELRRQLLPTTRLVANVGDQTAAGARQLREAGFVGVYHALRLREGIDSRLSPEERRRSIRHFQEAGLQVGTCVEPIGPEHSNEELAEMIQFTASIGPVFSGAARRIAIPGTSLARHGMISELRMAQIVAVTRLGVPRSVTGNCTHEPCALGAAAGANLFWAEAGANPRDTRERTEDGRGANVAECRRLFGEAGWQCLEGPSQFFRA